MRRLALLLTALLFIPTAQADINNDLNHFFNGLGMESNTTNPHAYKGQQAGYYSGGSVYARSSVRNVQLINVDLPSYRAGCGGIDAFAGGFSFVNHEQFVNLMRNIMNNAKGYMLKLSLAEVTPLIKNVLGDVERTANFINQSNINSCETAQGLVGGVWPKTQAAQQQVCKDVGASSGIFKDWAEARHGCTSEDEKYNFDSTMESGSKNEKYKQLITYKGNLVWRALKLNKLTAEDNELSELLMSLSGSIIINPVGHGKDATNQFEVLSSLATNQSLIKAMLNGDTATIYQCDESKECLKPKEKKVTISKNYALKTRVAKMLRNISEKILADQPLTQAEKGLIQSTRLPIYKILNVQAAYQKNPNFMEIDNYADVIATDILFQYLQENLDMVRQTSRSLQYPDNIMKQYMEQINQAFADVRSEEQKVQKKISMTMQLIESTQLLEKALAGQLSTRLGNSLNWARSLH